MTTLPLFPSGPLSTPAKLPPTLREYQKRAIQKLQLQVLNGKKRILLVAPCAAGKMVLAAYIIRTATIPVMFLCHLRELIDQCVDQLARQGITNVGVNRGDDDRYNPSASVQISSVQTLARRDPIIPPEMPIIILVDECHRSASISYRHILSQYPNAIVIGFTATPTRLDGKPLGGTLFEVLEIVATYQELLKNPEWLIGPIIFGAPVKPNLLGVRTVAGDYEENALSAVMRSDLLIGNAVDHWLRMAHLHPVFTPDGRQIPGRMVDGERRKTFCFAVNIDHSQTLAARFERMGVRVAHLDGKTPGDHRKAMLRDLESGAIGVICNCNILLEGVDLPALKCVVHCRPTKSLVLWMQSTARAFRPWHGLKPLILDHAGNFDRHSSPTEDRHWSLTHNARRMSSVEPSKTCPKCYAYINVALMVCPYCGHIFETAEPRTMQETEDQLVQRNTDPADLKQDYFQKMASLARSRGYKPGFASAKWREKYGSWPERAWSDGLKRIFETDAQWQALLAAREASKTVRAEAAATENKMWDAPVVPKEPAIACGTFAEPIAQESVVDPTAEKQRDSAVLTISPGEADPWNLREPTDAPFADWLREIGIES